MALALRADPGRDTHFSIYLHLNLCTFVWTDARSLDVAGYSDADVASLGAQPRLLIPDEPFVVDGGQRLVQHGLVIAAVIFERCEVLIDNLVVVWERIRGNEVAAPDLDAVDSQLARGEIEQTLNDEYAVLAAGATIGRDGRQIGEYRGKGAVVARHHIWPEQGALTVDRHRQAVGIVSPGVVQKHVLEAEHPSIAGERALGVVNLPTLVSGGEEMLAPVLDPLDRPAQLDRRPRQQDFLRVEHHDLRAKAAADERRNHANLTLAQAQHAGEPVADEHRRLGGVPDGKLVGTGVPLRDDTARFDR